MVHAHVAMSNHHHCVVTDPHARLPEFLQLLHRLVACVMNAALNRTENFWATGQTSVVRLVEASDVIDKIAYVVTNPCAAGLVQKPNSWPGSSTTGFAQTRSAKRPPVFFRTNGAMPDSATLSTAIPPCLAHLGLSAAQRAVDEAVGARLRRIRTQMSRDGRRFLGARRTIRRSAESTAKSVEERRAHRPRFAGTFAARRHLRAEFRSFLAHYRAALVAYRGGMRTVRFPVGTYAMRVNYGAVCVGPPA